MRMTRLLSCALVIVNLGVVLCGCDPRDDEPPAREASPTESSELPGEQATDAVAPEIPMSPIFRLPPGGYSPVANALLMTVCVPTGGSEYGFPKMTRFLARYEEKEKLLGTHLLPTATSLFDVAWIPGKSAFIVTHGDRMTLYRRDAGGTFAGTAVPCPVDFLYVYCSWNPEGRWLALMCSDIRIGKGGFKLGLYDRKRNRYVGGTIVMEPVRPVWKDNATVYVLTDRGLAEVRVETPLHAPAIMRIIPLQTGVSQFYGMFEALPLTRQGKEIRLGNSTLAELDHASDVRVAMTDTTIFISASPSRLLAFNRQGHNVAALDPGSTIQLGPAAGAPPRAYGLVDSRLLCVTLDGTTLRTEELCDLSNFQGAQEIAGHAIP